MPARSEERSDRPRRPRARRAMLPVAAAALAIAIGACGSDDSTESDGGASTRAAPVAPSTAGLPPALAANLRDANKIVGEGGDDFQQRLDALRGHPVVVNQWASWCESCRFEFPFFRNLAAKYKKDVAFLGLDSQDDRGSAEDFLAEMPGDFPSILDKDASVAASIGGGQSWPTTFFFDEQGQQVNIKIGAYATQELLEEDIRRFALGEDS